MSARKSTPASRSWILAATFCATLVLAAASPAAADGVILRGESIALGAVAPNLALRDGRVVDLRRLTQPSLQLPPFAAGTLLVHDLDTQQTRLATSEIATRHLLAAEGDDDAEIGDLLDEPGDLIFYETPVAGPNDPLHADRFFAIDAGNAPALFLSNPGVPVPEPTGGLFVAVLSLVLFGRASASRT